MHTAITVIAAITTLTTAMAGALPSQDASSSAAERQIVRVEGNEFVVRTESGAELRGEQVLGLTLNLPDGTIVRLDSVKRDAMVPDLFLYGLKVRDASRGDWRPLCAPDPRGEQVGFPLQGRTDNEGGFVADPSAIRLTCTTGALAKCVRYGYRYWDRRGVRADLVPFYQSCVRMMRADYCGDGKPATRPGIEIDMWDGEVVHRRPPSIEGQFEAGWTPAGAVCVNHARVKAVESLPDVVQRCPRLAATSGESCTEERARAQGALLFNASSVQE